MPRAFSCGRRSVSTPVSARTSAVLPWSMWPAVPSVRAACAFSRPCGPRHRPRVTSSVCMGARSWPMTSNRLVRIRERVPDRSRLRVAGSRSLKISPRTTDQSGGQSGASASISARASRDAATSRSSSAACCASRLKADHGNTARTARATSRASSSVSVRGSSSSRPSWMRPTTAGSPARRRAASASAPAGPGSIATAGPGSSSSGSAPPPTRAVDATTVPPVAAASSSRAPAQRRLVGFEHREHRQRAARGGRVAMQGEGRLERGERQLVDPHGPRERMAAARLDRLARSDEQPRLRAAEQLVARERRERGAGADRSAHRRLAGEQLEVVGEHARADVVDDRHAEVAERLDLDLLDEADGAEVRGVRAQDRPDPLAARPPAPPRSRRGACGSSCPPRRAACRRPRGSRGSGSRRRSR